MDDQTLFYAVLIFSGGFGLGFFAGIFFSKRLDAIKTYAVIVTIVWLVLTVVSFWLNKEMPFFFNFIGGITLGQVLGLDISTAVDLFDKAKDRL